MRPRPPPATALLALLALAAGGGCSASGPAPVPALTCQAADWPTAATAGLPADAGPLTVLTETTHTTGPGQVIEGVELRGRLYVDHDGVVIRRSRLVGDAYYAVYSTAGGTNLTVEDCDITGGVKIGDGFVGRRDHLHAPAGGTRDDGWILAASHVLLEDNLVDGLVGDAGAHVDGIQVMAGDDLTLRHNRIEAVSPAIAGGGVNAAIFLAPDLGPISNATLDCNLLVEQDGWYPLRVQAQGTVVARRNRWQRGFLGTAPVLATDTAFTVWEDNAYLDGEAIPAP